MNASKAASAEIHADEFKLLRLVASAFRVADAEELQAELAAKLLELKARGPREIRDWTAYLAKFFYNKAHNFARNERARGRREWSAIAGDPSSSESARPAAMDETACVELSFAFARAWRELKKADRKLWATLAENGGNQSAVAQTLGVHRNTVRLRLSRIRRLLDRYGLSENGV